MPSSAPPQITDSRIQSSGDGRVSSAIGVQATLVRSDGAVNLVLTSEETGAAQAISLSATGNAAVEAAR